MDTSNKKIHISGHGSVAAGDYSEIHISGSGSASGDISCDSLHISGSGSFEGIQCRGDIRISGSAKCAGQLQANELHISGSTHIEDDMNVDALRISGSATVNGDVQAREAHVSGGLHVNGALRGHTMRLSGRLHVTEGVECETLEMSGGFTAKGLLNAENVRIRLGGRCQAEEIGGENIEVRLHDNTSGGWIGLISILSFNTNNERYLEVDVIEGTNVYLENTHANIVRGQNIEIGANCRIGRVEYSGEYKADPSSQIDAQAKVAP